MLGKLMKYEFKASSRVFVLIYGALIFLSIINAILLPLDNALDSYGGAIYTIYVVLQSLFMFTYILVVISTAVVTLILIIMRFYKNLLGDEGYLMFTLPVSTDSQILSKLISGVIWSILSTVVIIGSLLILTIRYDVFEDIRNTLEAVSAAGLNVPMWILGVVLTVILYLISAILMFYVAMAIGSNLTKNRLLGSFLGYMIAYLVGQIIGLISIVVVFFSGIMEQWTAYDSKVISTTQLLSELDIFGFQMFLYINILSAITIAIYYVGTRYFIKNKLNLA